MTHLEASPPPAAALTNTRRCHAVIVVGVVAKTGRSRVSGMTSHLVGGAPLAEELFAFAFAIYSRYTIQVHNRDNPKKERKMKKKAINLTRAK